METRNIMTTIETLDQYIIKLQAINNPKQIQVEVEAILKAIPVQTLLTCPGINFTAGANDPQIAILKTLLQKIGFYRGLSITNVWDNPTSGNFMTAQLCQGNLLVDNDLGPLSCAQFNLGQPNSRRALLYANNEDNTVYVSNINNAGFTDVAYFNFNPNMV